MSCFAVNVSNGPWYNDQRKQLHYQVKDKQFREQVQLIPHRNRRGLQRLNKDCCIFCWDLIAPELLPCGWAVNMQMSCHEMMQGSQEEIWDTAQEPGWKWTWTLRLLPPKLKSRYCSKDRFTVSRKYSRHGQGPTRPHKQGQANSLREN